MAMEWDECRGEAKRRRGMLFLHFPFYLLYFAFPHSNKYCPQTLHGGRIRDALLKVHIAPSR